MDLDLHITRFDWAGAPAAIGQGVARLARTAEAVGIKTLSVMDHYFQMDAVAPAEDPMLEGYTTLGFIAAITQRLRLRVLVTDRVAPGVVYTTFHHPETQANVVTTDFSDWATNCPEYKVTAVQVMPSNGPSEWQEEYTELAERSRRIAPDEAMEPAE